MLLQPQTGAYMPEHNVGISTHLPLPPQLLGWYSQNSFDAQSALVEQIGAKATCRVTAASTFDGVVYIPMNNTMTSMSIVIF